MKHANEAALRSVVKATADLLIAFGKPRRSELRPDFPNDPVCRATRFAMRVGSACRNWVSLPKLGGLDVFGTGTLGALAGGEGHGLTFVQIVVGRALNALRMEEQILVASGLDESEAFVRQLFDRAFSHLNVYLENVFGSTPPG